LLGLFRGRASEGSFDRREYLIASPIGFSHLAGKFLDLKKKTMRPESYRRYKNFSEKACAFFGDKPITQIRTGDLEDFIHSLEGLSTYTVKIILDFTVSILRWAKDRGELEEVPKKPAWKWKQGMRKILDKHTQAKVIEVLYEKHWDRVPRACVAVELLATYPKIRPGELLQVKEKDIDLVSGMICIPQPKESQDPKFVRLLPQHIELIKSLPRGFPEMPFLRYDLPVKGRRVGQKFGKDYLYRLWGEVCDGMGIKGVPLYPGTKHSTATALARQFPSELVRKTTGHASKAFERYLVLSEDDCMNLYAAALPDNVLTTPFRGEREN
jgi:integrase